MKKTLRQMEIWSWQNVLNMVNGTKKYVASFNKERFQVEMYEMFNTIYIFIVISFYSRLV